MKFLKNNKKLTIALIVVLFLLFMFLIYKILFGGNGNGVYGNRLKEIDNVKISKNTEEKLIKELEAHDEVEKVSYKLKGRIINVILTVNDETSLDRGKEIANEVLNYFDDDEKEYYDFQVFLNSSNDSSETYPKIGYKNNTSEGFVWKQE